MRIIIEIEEGGRLTTFRDDDTPARRDEAVPAPAVESAGDAVDAGPPVPPASLDEEVAQRARAEASEGPSPADAGGPPEIDREG